VELQFHPSTGRRAVAVLPLGPGAQRLLVVAAALAAGALVSLWATVPSVLLRISRSADLPARGRELESARRARAEALRRASGLAARALDSGDRLSRIAFLYGVEPSRWPRALDPARGLLRGGPDAERLPDDLDVYLRGLERARATLEEAESSDPTLAARTPAIAPIGGDLYEPAVLFGPRVSPWTGQEEFFTGLDLAAPEGTPVVAPAEGRVVFVGRARRDVAPRLWQFGNLVVLSHGPGLATLFGHLDRAEARRGDRVKRGQRLGVVGKTGWTQSPRVHYELWRMEGGRLRPTDPLFAILDRRLDDARRSLGEMRGTSAPEPYDPLPGLP
jgi:murein DD-endopeptidase MepM/ murein hydrolase activator NlpD